MKKIAIYGKGGIGKSTTVSNLSVALAKMGYRVMQIGCDPKADSTVNLTGGVSIPTVLATLSEKGKINNPDEVVKIGTEGVFCVETGGPKPGCGCAGRGVIAAFEQLDLLNAYEKYKPDVILYDVLGDVVCGGFALPIRNGYAKDIYIVTSGEKMALFAAKNIGQSVVNNSMRGYAKVKGLILNSRNVKNELELVTKTADEMGVPVTIVLPRSDTVQEAEENGMTVVEYAPDSEMGKKYFELAKILMDNYDE